MSAASQASPAPANNGWIYRPWLDLLVGCGAWSAPLLLLVYPMRISNSAGWAVAFYGLALFFNYPHYMATVYRAYHTREDFAKYRIFTLHLTALLALTAVLAHLSFRMLPWLFTLYITWSPWHYTGQNYGLAMMFARRRGAQPSYTVRRALYLSFLASYIVLFLSFHTGASNDPLVLSLGIPQKFSNPVMLVSGVAFAFLGLWALIHLVEQTSLRAMLPAITLWSTQFLWFLLPTLLGYIYRVPLPQTRYSTGILAVMHSAQYLWITSYYARREANAEGRAGWRPWIYFLTLIAGGIALFVPGPWLISWAFHFDFAASFLIFTALVNIHHFLLDGAIWKLRDGRIAELLIGAGRDVSGAARQAARPIAGAASWLVGQSAPARVLRIAACVLLLVWGGLDQIRYFMGTLEENLPGLKRAAALDPYDSVIQTRIARAESGSGSIDNAIAAMQTAIAANPANLGTRRSLARLLVESGRYPEAYAAYKDVVAHQPASEDLINFGVLAAQLGHPEEAGASWQKAVDLDPTQINAQLYLANWLDEQQQPAAAISHYQEYVRQVSQHRQQKPAPELMISVLLKLASAEYRTGEWQPAAKSSETAIRLAHEFGQNGLEAAGASLLAASLEKLGRLADAGNSYRRTLQLNGDISDPKRRAIDWFNYGEFLVQHGGAQPVAYVCLLKSEELLGSEKSPELDMVKEARRQVEKQMKPSALADARKNMSNLLAQAVASSQ